MALPWPNKDPDEVVDYDLDWNDAESPNAAWASGDVITASDWIIESGTVAIQSDTFTNTVTKVWLNGGTIGETCVLTNRITTQGGRILDQSIKLKIKAH